MSKVAFCDFRGGGEARNTHTKRLSRWHWCWCWQKKKTRDICN